MRFQVINGKNNKIFVAISDVITKEDIELQEIVRNVCSRTEYKPFISGFNKNISYSYLFNDIFFPVQFWQDVKTQLEKIATFPIHLENEELLYNNEFSRDDFDAFINQYKFPEEILVDAEEYKYQQDCAFLAIQNKIARIEVGTSGGKTFITYLYCKYLHEKIIPKDKKILIIVPSKLLCKQLQKNFKEFEEHISKKLIVETIFSGATAYLDSDIVCGTYQSLSNYDKEYFNDFAVVICDEAQGAKAYSIKNEIYNKTLDAEYFFAMTGTYPKYKTLDYLHIVSMFGPLIYVKQAWELIEDGVATPIVIHKIKIEYDEFKDYSQNLKENGILGKEKYGLEKEFFHKLEPRTKILGKLLNGIPGNALILVDTVEYCGILYDYLTDFCPDREFGIIHGKTLNRDDIIENMKETENYVIIGTYGTMSTGVSINNIKLMFFPDGGKSEIRIRQSLGRGMRKFLNKLLCLVFDFQDNLKGCAFKNHSVERNRIYAEQNFPTKITIVKI